MCRVARKIMWYFEKMSEPHPYLHVEAKSFAGLPEHSTPIDSYPQKTLGLRLPPPDKFVNYPKNRSSPSAGQACPENFAQCWPKTLRDPPLERRETDLERPTFREERD